MKKVLILIVSLMICSVFASGNYTINQGEMEAYAAADMPASFYLKNVTPGKPIMLSIRDLHDDAGPAMKFRVTAHGAVDGGFGLTAAGEGDYNAFIPGYAVGEHTVITVFDENRKVNVINPLWPAAKLTFNAMQDVPTYPEVEVYTKDHHLASPTIYIWSLYVKNTGSVDVVNPTVRYFFTTEQVETALTLIDYYTPLADIQLLRVPGTNEYALEFNYAGTTLESGETTQPAVENQVQLYYNGYGDIDKFNDYSNPIPEELGNLPESTLFKINNKCAVYNENGTLIGGTEVPGYSADQFVPVQ